MTCTFRAGVCLCVFLTDCRCVQATIILNNLPVLGVKRKRVTQIILFNMFCSTIWVFLIAMQPEYHCHHDYYHRCQHQNGSVHGMLHGRTCLQAHMHACEPMCSIYVHAFFGFLPANSSSHLSASVHHELLLRSPNTPLGSGCQGHRIGILTVG